MRVANYSRVEGSSTSIRALERTVTRVFIRHARVLARVLVRTEEQREWRKVVVAIDEANRRLKRKK